MTCSYLLLHCCRVGDHRIIRAFCDARACSRRSHPIRCPCSRSREPPLLQALLSFFAAHLRHLILALPPRLICVECLLESLAPLVRAAPRTERWWYSTHTSLSLNTYRSSFLFLSPLDSSFSFRSHSARFFVDVILFLSPFLSPLLHTDTHTHTQTHTHRERERA